MSIWRVFYPNNDIGPVFLVPGRMCVMRLNERERGLGLPPDSRLRLRDDHVQIGKGDPEQ